MYRLSGYAAAALAVLAGGATAQAQYFHGHLHYHNGHYHLHGHWHYPNYYPYPAAPVVVGPRLYAPVVRPAVVVLPPSAPAPAGVVVAPAVGAPALRANPLPAPALVPASGGPGLTLRLPAEYPNPVHVRVEKRDYELRPGTEVTVRDRASYLVEFDQGGAFGPFSAEYVEGVYRFVVGARGWRLEPDAPRPNALPAPPRP
ncbi:hypothetical protein J0H58_10925 [bacterium]|nr:hypothetical protein [bacterium]